jgi:hypothetical protein
VSLCDAGNAQTENDRQDGNPQLIAICRYSHASPPHSKGVLSSLRKQYYSGLSSATKYYVTLLARAKGVIVLITASSIARHDCENAVIDGEIASVDDDGRS